METNRAQWLTNQYPENWSAKVASDALCKIIEGKGKPLDDERRLSTITIRCEVLNADDAI